VQAKTASNVKIIDVSHHQDKIDWKKVAADGVQGVFIKATEGGSMIDLKLSSNAQGASAAGLKIGFYHYAHPELNAPETEAANFYRNVKQYKADFPHVLDVEGAAAGIGADKLTAWCVKYLQEVEKLTGHPAMLYTGASFAKSNLGKELSKWPLWVAHYGATTPMANSTWDAWSVFQYTSSGTVSGIVGHADVNAMEVAFYNKYAGVKPIPQPTADDTIKVVVNDVLAAYGRIVENHVYLPLRDLGEALGAEVRWDAATSTPYINGKPLTKFLLLSGKTYIGVRAAAELLGGRVSFDGQTKKVYFYET
jgi:lysozyme